MASSQIQSKSSKSSNKVQDPKSADNGNDVELKENFIFEYRDGSIRLEFWAYESEVNDYFVRQMFNHGKIKNKQVRGIALSECINITDATAEFIAKSKQCKNMKEIYLGRCHNLTDKGIIAIVNSNPELKVLYIRHCTKLTDASMEAVVRGCRDLEQLRVDGIGLTSLPDDMFDILPQLKSVNLQGNKLTKLPTSIEKMKNCQILVDPHLLGKEELDRIQSSLSSEAIEELIISDMGGKHAQINLEFSRFPDQTNDSLVQHILCGDKIKNKQVINIKLWGCKNFTDATAELIANSEQCKHVKEIYLTGNNNLTDKGILAIVSSIPHLTSFGFDSSSNKLTDACMEAIVRECHDLKILSADGIGLTSLPDDIFAKLPKLKGLFLQNNKLTELPTSIVKLTKEFHLALDGNPLQDPPLAVFLRDGINGSLRYREDVKNGYKPSNTLKTVFVGDGEAGKTSLLNLIRGNEKPRTTKEARTIHLDLVDVQIDLDGGRKLNLTCYDCGGQKQYTLGQTAFLTSSALYLLCVNAEEPDMHKFLRFLFILQARAPGAVVQVVLTKIDRVDDPEEKKAEVKKEIETFVEDCRVHNRRRDYGKKCQLLDIREEIIMTSLIKTDELDKTRKLIIKKISDLTRASPLLFPTVGQKIPKSWLSCEKFLCKLRDEGREGVKNETFNEELTNQNSSSNEALPVQNATQEESDAFQTIISFDKDVQVTTNYNDTSFAANNSRGDRWHDFTKNEVNIQAILIGLLCSLFILPWFEVPRSRCDAADQSHFDQFSSLDCRWMAFGLLLPQIKAKEDSIIDDCPTRVSPLTLTSILSLGFGLIGSLVLYNKSFNLRGHIKIDTDVLGEEEGDDYSSPSTNRCIETKDETSTIFCPYMARSEILELWKSICDQQRGQTGSILSVTNLQDVLTILEAEGTVFTFGDLVFLHPPFIADIMKPLSNHFLNLEEIDSSHFRTNEMNKFVKALPVNQKITVADLKDRLVSFVRFGKIGGEINAQNVLLQFMWRDLSKLDKRHYHKVIDMFRDSGVIIDSTFDVSENRLTEKHPIFVFRLPSNKPSGDANSANSHWPLKCPENETHFELRIELSAGCPEMLAMMFAAKCHAFGQCLHAWIHGATILMKDKNDKIHAELIKPTTGCDYILFAVRTHSLSDEYSKFLCSLAESFMKDQEKRLPGLLFAIRWTCPLCIKRVNKEGPKQEVKTFPLNPGENGEACMTCGQHVEMVTIKMAVSPEDAYILSCNMNHDEGNMRLILSMLKGITSRLNELPDIILNIHEVLHPYLFQIISETDFKEFSKDLEKLNSNGTDDVIDMLDETENVLAKVRNGAELITLSSHLKKSFLSKLGIKKKNAYLQLLDGISFQPIMTYKVETSELSRNMQKIVKVGADLCTIGIKASVLWNATGTIASAFGIPVEMMNKEQIEKIRSFLVKVKEGNPLDPGDDIANFGTYLKELDGKSKVCHFLDNVKEDEVKEKKWSDALRKATVRTQSGKTQLTWIDKRAVTAGLGYIS